MTVDEKVMVGAQVEPDVVQWIDDMARRNGNCSRAAVVRWALHKTMRLSRVRVDDDGGEREAVLA